MKWLWSVILGIISVIYPFLWYIGREKGWFVYLAATMCLLWGTRAILQRDKIQKIIALCIAVFFALMWVLRLPQSMYWYPVWVNGLMFLAFVGSLFSSQSLIERLARLQNPDLPLKGVVYTRKVTQIWCIFFIFNGSIAAALVLLSYYDWWAIYTGIIAYILMGLLMSGEWCYRKWILKV